jgi:leukotriene-A4 hydrolase
MKYLYLILMLGLVACGSSQQSEEKNQTQTPMQTQGDVHSFAQPDEAQMTDLALDIKVDFAKKIISGKASITFENKKAAQKLFLDTKELIISRVTLGKDEKETKFQLSKEQMFKGSALAIDIQPDTKLVNVYYETSPTAGALQWLNPTQTAGKQKPFLFTQSQAILARTWVPCQDSPGIRFTYSAKVQVPQDLWAVMSAENPIKRNQSGIYEFKMPQPIPAYLLALAVGDLDFIALSENTGVYAEPSLLKKSADEFADLPKMLAAAEKLYGKYAWGRYDVIVLPPSFPFGGMENPRLTFATPTILAGDRSLVSLIAHELAHSWSGNLVTNSTWNDFWLNEGFTVYFERRIMEAIQGKSYSDMLALLGYQDLQETLTDLKAQPEDTQLKLNLAGRDPDEGVSDIAYEKGFFFLRMIEEAIGREKMDAFLKQYFQENAFKTMDTERFLTYIQEKLPETQKLNLKEWIYEAGLPKNCPIPKSERFDHVGSATSCYIKTMKITCLDAEWSSHEWLYFLRLLARSVNDAYLLDLDRNFKFSESGNSEILAQWFQLAIQSNYEKAYPAMEKFLTSVGRRKFLVPIYAALLKNPQTKALAKEIYTKARPNYHFVAVNTLDEMMKK